MVIVPIDSFAVAVDVPFLAPMGFTQARLEEFAGRICDRENGFSLRPDQIRLRRTDELYNYELSAQFFGENGSLTRTALGVHMAIRNGRTAADWKVMEETLRRFYTALEFDPKTVTTFAAHMHAQFPTLEERDQYLSQFAHNPMIHQPAALGYVQIFGWEKDVRVLIEASRQAPNSVFVGWDTQFNNTQLWAPFLGTLPAMMEDTANLFGLGFEPFKQHV